MTTTEPFDLFEQRLAATLAAEADTVTAPEDGLAVIRGRVARHRRARRATWLAAAAALVLIAGTVGVLLRSSSSDSAPYVDTDATGGMPLLGFGDSEWSVFQYAPGMSYLVTQSNGDPATAGRYLQLINDGADLGPGAFSWDADETATVGGRRVEIGIQTTDDGFGNVTTTDAVWWNAGNGWTVTVTTGLAAQGDGDRDDLLAAAAAVTEVPLDLWQQRFATPSPPPRPLTEPMLVLDGESGGAQVIAISGSSATAWLTPSVGDLPNVILLALPPTAEQAFLEQSDAGTPIDVRGTNAYFSSAGDGSPRARLIWTEGGQSYEISALAGSPSEQLASIAELLVLPNAERWQQLVFPDEPRDFPDDAIFRVDPSDPSGP